eukprot:5559183-Pleurochrysis_carterae.AAC.2
MRTAHALSGSVATCSRLPNLPDLPAYFSRSVQPAFSLHAGSHRDRSRNESPPVSKTFRDLTRPSYLAFLFVPKFRFRSNIYGIAIHSLLVTAIVNLQAQIVDRLSSKRACGYRSGAEAVDLDFSDCRVLAICIDTIHNYAPCVANPVGSPQCASHVSD